MRSPGKEGGMGGWEVIAFTPPPNPPFLLPEEFHIRGECISQCVFVSPFRPRPVLSLPTLLAPLHCAAVALIVAVWFEALFAHSGERCH